MARNTGNHHPFDAREDFFYQAAAGRFNSIIDDIARIAGDIDDEVVSDRRIASLFSDLVGRRMEEEGFRPNLELPRNASEHLWFDEHTLTAYEQGAEDAESLLEATGHAPGTRSIEESPNHQDALDRLFGDQRQHWHGVADDVEDGIEQRVLDVLDAEDGTVRDAKDAVADRLDHVGKYRSRLIAESETGRAYNEALIAEYEEAGVEEVRVEEVEWQTAGDHRVCESCASMAGTYDLDEAKRMLRAGEFPHHPRCRCLFAPA